MIIQIYLDKFASKSPIKTKIKNNFSKLSLMQCFQSLKGDLYNVDISINLRMYFISQIKHSRKREI